MTCSKCGAYTPDGGCEHCGYVSTSGSSHPQGCMCDECASVVPDWRNRVPEPFYKGKGEHSVKALEKLCEDFKEALYQKQIKLQETEEKLRKADAIWNAQAAKIENLEKKIEILQDDHGNMYQTTRTMEKHHTTEREHLISECRQELARKDERIAYLEKEVSRVFDPTKKFWSDQMDELLDYVITKMQEAAVTSMEPGMKDFLEDGIAEIKKQRRLL